MQRRCGKRILMAAMLFFLQDFLCFIVVVSFIFFLPLCEINTMTAQESNGGDAALVAFCSDLIELQRKKVHT